MDGRKLSVKSAREEPSEFVFESVECCVRVFEKTYPNGIRFEEKYRLPGSPFYNVTLIHLMEEGIFCKKTGERYKDSSIAAQASYASFKPHPELSNVFLIKDNIVTVHYDAEKYRAAFGSGPGRKHNNVKLGIKLCLLYLFYSLDQSWAEAVMWPILKFNVTVTAVPAAQRPKLVKKKAVVTAVPAVVKKKAVVTAVPAVVKKKAVVPANAGGDGGHFYTCATEQLISLDFSTNEVTKPVNSPYMDALLAMGMPPCVQQKEVAPARVQQKEVAPARVQQKEVAPARVQQKEVAPARVQQKVISHPIVKDNETDIMSLFVDLIQQFEDLKRTITENKTQFHEISDRLSALEGKQ